MHRLAWAAIEGGLYSKSSIVLDQAAKVLQAVNAEEGISVVKGGKDD
jgi:hypothetical protein